jgi:uncharacterized phage-associated protein
VPGQGVVAERVKGGKYAPTLPEIYKNNAKNGMFPILFDLKISKKAVFYSKVRNKI